MSLVVFGLGMGPLELPTRADEASRAAAAAAPPAIHVLPLFSISKSENKNQVQYAIRVDDRCVPLADTPVFAYWRMLEQGPTRTEPLLAHELPAYGIASQVRTAGGPQGTRIVLTLRALPSHAIEVETLPSTAGGGCQALSTATINGAPAHLYDVYVRLKWFFGGVDYLLLQGWSMDGTHLVTERLGG
jgi:hypothetical protein